MSYPSFHI